MNKKAATSINPQSIGKPIVVLESITGDEINVPGEHIPEGVNGYVTDKTGSGTYRVWFSSTHTFPTGKSWNIWGNSLAKVLVIEPDGEAPDFVSISLYPKE